MKKGFLKPFAVTVGTMLAASTANAEAPSFGADSPSIISSATYKLAGADVTLQHAGGSLELAAHGSHASHSSHSSHSSHASHASHSSHASSSF